MIKILFLINTLGGGGAERVLVNLVNNMDKSAFEITVVTMFADGVNRKLLVPEIHFLHRNKLHIRGISKLIPFIPPDLLYRYYIGSDDYDIVVAYMHGAPTKAVAGCSNRTSKKVAWLHYGDPEKGSFFNYWFNRKTAIQAYASMDAIVGVSNSVTKAFENYTGIRNITLTLYNTNDTERIIRMASMPLTESMRKDHPIICTSGRLTRQKGFDRLILAVSKLRREDYKFQIFIMGSGSEETKLKKLIVENGVKECVNLLGFCENPYNIMASSDLYISSSREEGLATVLTEALTLGLPVISTDVSGAKEVLGEQNEYGLVVDNSTEGIYWGLKDYLDNPNKFESYKETAKERARIFSTQNTVHATEEFFKNLLQ